ncbi:GNAT family N-acetyltransferase [Vibrio mangrovi]|uniref:tRNA(Met) cytidine acetyltransferase TmcA n=1 Tax=Vibrio mangrovi TaxID=474394 RepID=A0A1Y6J0D3_9VIBR|nr:GNAT family N-acetyltransferase [Vibrio mangrovi]MDW6004979.1 GNAT family N-acetyltransferase [Vibrio mangrovi]SMS01743.1 tRNA(Met) cytidine acetyltransferase TmcA [Vibrio mangrovi]
MPAFSEIISSLQSYLTDSFCRAGVVLRGEPEWTDELLLQLNDHFYAVRRIQLGGSPRDGYEWIDFKQGRRLLGQECSLLVVDLSLGFDADSFNALLGTLQGGGLLVFVGESGRHSDHAQKWLHRALERLILVEQQVNSVCFDFLPIPLQKNPFEQQEKAVDAIVHVVEGHRNRPLVLTADRGRGKSSALGIAAAKLMERRPSIQIIVTAPSYAAVGPVFHHLLRVLSDGKMQAKQFIYREARLQFVPPDELLHSHQSCDLLLIDEASAIPVPLLTDLTRQYHRLVFSTTIHGYEGCGRGFTLKFLPWLKQLRPALRHQKLSMPIRWSEGDPLEQWQYQTFLLDAELPDISEKKAEEPVQYHYLSGETLLNDPELLANIFSLLTNAHYQTTPNDLMGVLSDPNIAVFVARSQHHLLGCALTIQEGPLSSQTVIRIQRGQHRPKGHLVPTTLVNQLGLSAAASASCCRVMRLAVHPDLQHQGYGSALLSELIRQCPADYVATSFGATSELLRFWGKNNFHPVKIGSRRDQASGCYSIVMIYQSPHAWFDTAREQFSYYFSHALKTELIRLEPDVVRQLLKMKVALPITDIATSLIQNYAQGGANYESVAVWIHLYISMLPYEYIDMVDDLLVAKVLQNQEWSLVAACYSLTGRKQIEERIRENLSAIMMTLQCKSQK